MDYVDVLYPVLCLKVEHVLKKIPDNGLQFELNSWAPFFIVQLLQSKCALNMMCNQSFCTLQPGTKFATKCVNMLCRFFFIKALMWNRTECRSCFVENVNDECQKHLCGGNNAKPIDHDTETFDLNSFAWWYSRRLALSLVGHLSLCMQVWSENYQ